jgi:signal peptide peptidase SppA
LSDRFLAHIAGEVLGRPLMILPDKLAIIAAVLGGRIGLDDPEALALGPVASRFVGNRVDASRRALPYARTDDGAAVITVTGSLVNRGAWIGASSGLTSYEGFKHQLASAVADGEAKAIVIDMETPGGSVVGVFEAADAVRAAAAVKPVIAIVNGMAASAGYLIASAASRIITTPSGISGSIGVRAIHIEQSRKMDREGITPTIISAGEGKDFANPFEPLSPAAHAELQATVDKAYDQLVAAVAAGRRGLSQKAVRALGAHVFTGQEAVDAGLADEIGTFESTISTVTRGAFTRRAAQRSMSMEITQADLDRAVAQARTEAHAAGKAEGVAEGQTAGHAAGLAEGRTAGVTAERERLAAICGLEEAQGREATARHIALSSDMSAEQAKAFLALVPKASSLEARAGVVVTTGAAAASDPTGAEAVTASWDKVVASINTGIKGERRRDA